MHSRHRAPAGDHEYIRHTSRDPGGSRVWPWRWSPPAPRRRAPRSRTRPARRSSSRRTVLDTNHSTDTTRGPQPELPPPLSPRPVVRLLVPVPRIRANGARPAQGGRPVPAFEALAVTMLHQAPVRPASGPQRRRGQHRRDVVGSGHRADRPRLRAVAVRFHPRPQPARARRGLGGGAHRQPPLRRHRRLRRRQSLGRARRTRPCRLCPAAVPTSAYASAFHEPDRAHRRVRLRHRRPHRGARTDATAAAREHRLLRRHGARPVRHRRAPRRSSATAARSPTFSQRAA